MAYSSAVTCGGVEKIEKKTYHFNLSKCPPLNCNNSLKVEPPYLLTLYQYLLPLNEF